MPVLLKNKRVDQLREDIRDPFWFINRMTIVDKHGKINQLKLHWAQQDALEAMIKYRFTLVLKARQLGFTTLSAAFLLHRALFVADHDYDILTITHEMAACGRVNLMLKNYIRWLPTFLRPTVIKDNAQEIVVRTPDGRTCAFRQVMAGGRSQARSYTYRALHLTEAGFWPRGSAAHAGSAVDEDMYASALSTLHQDDWTRILVESTANGPHGVYHRLVLTAMDSDEWAFRFYPWFKFADYRRKPAADWERTDDEQQLADLHNLDDEQLAFRRDKIIDQGIGLTRFRKEYPSTWMEPFLVTGGVWFSYDRLNEWLAALGSQVIDRDGLRTHLDPEPGRKYFMGGDPSGGTGRDSGVWQIVRDDLRQACTFSSRDMQPAQFAEMGAKLYARYHTAPPVVESNSYGRAVLKRMAELGVPTWKDEKGKDWWTDPRTKAMVYDYARNVVDSGHVTLVDPLTIRECMNVREQEDGTIQADEGKHDDHPMALALALWCARRQYSAQTKPVLPVHIARERRHRELGLGGKSGSKRR